MIHSRGSTIGINLLVAVWGTSVLAGGYAMFRYQTSPGLAATPPPKIQRLAAKTQLLVFLHPQCECSAATISELQRVMSKVGDRFLITAYFYKPAGEPFSWCSSSNLWREAGRIPNLQRVIDTDAKFARHYGAHCSGQVLIYGGANGTLVFSGGITESRGHEGESRGGDAVLEYGETGHTLVKKTNVFGCAIW